MSRSLRYDDPELCDALAAQYVAGDMTSRVRRRMDALMQTHPRLRAAVASWTARMTPLQQAYPERTPPTGLWSRIERALEPETHPARKPVPTVWHRLWHHLSLWRATALGGVAASAALLVMLWLGAVQAPTPGGADYLAPMTWQDDVALVVTGYRGKEGRDAWLSARWSDRLDDRPEGDLHLWAETGPNRNWVHLGPVSRDNRSWAVDKADWQVVQASHRLVVNTSPEQISPQLALLEGPCIRLSKW